MKEKIIDEILVLIKKQLMEKVPEDTETLVVNDWPSPVIGLSAFKGEFSKRVTVELRKLK